MIIQIETDGDRRHVISVGDRYIEHLSADEAFWAVAHLMMGKDPPWGGLRTAEEHAAEEAAHVAKMKRLFPTRGLEPWQKQLRAAPNDWEVLVTKANHGPAIYADNLNEAEARDLAIHQNNNMLKCMVVFGGAVVPKFFEARKVGRS